MIPAVEILPCTALPVLFICPAVEILPPVMLPVAVMIPAVEILPPVMLPVAVIIPAEIFPALMETHRLVGLPSEYVTLAEGIIFPAHPVSAYEDTLALA